MKEITVTTLYHYPHFESKENIEADFLDTTFMGTLINHNNYNLADIRVESISVYAFVTSDLIENGDDLHFTHTEDNLTVDHKLYNITINPESLTKAYRIIEGGTFGQTWSVTN